MLTRMHAIELVFAIGWALFWVYWLAAAFTMKKEPSHGLANCASGR